MTKPTHSTTAGARYLALRKQAKATGRPTAELLQLYLLEGFLARLARSARRDQLVLKGGVLLAAFELRRPTQDIDFLAQNTHNDPATVGALIAEVAAVAIDDGLEFHPGTVTTSPIRDSDQYPGVRVRLTAGLATAKLRLQVDVNVGDPIVPDAQETQIPALLGGTGPTVLAYPRAMVLAEKLLTALERGSGSTRWRDFADLYLMIDARPLRGESVVPSIRTVAQHRGVRLMPLGDVLGDMPDRAQSRWLAWLTLHGLQDRVPQSFGELLQYLDTHTREVIAQAAADQPSD